MDALAQGYGSDSDSSSSSNFKSSSPPKQSQHLNLLANYSDDDSSTDENGNTPVAQDSNEITKQNIETNNSKKRKLDTEAKSAVDPLPSIEITTLPDPRLLLSSASSTEYTVLFEKNYIVSKLKYSAPNMNKALQEKLKQMSQHQGTGNCFATKLKSQKDFLNPHMFPSVIEHFGIDPMESNIGSENLDDASSEIINKQACDSCISFQFGKFEYIDRLRVKEEENRIREAQQQNI